MVADVQYGGKITDDLTVSFRPTLGWLNSCAMKHIRTVRQCDFRPRVFLSSFYIFLLSSCPYSTVFIASSQLNPLNILVRRSSACRTTPHDPIWTEIKGTRLRYDVSGDRLAGGLRLASKSDLTFNEVGALIQLLVRPSRRAPGWRWVSRRCRAEQAPALERL